MRLRTIVKFGTLISVFLFCLAVGIYAFMRLELTERNRNQNLYSLVPADCIGVLETDAINDFLNDYSALNYGHELSGIQIPDFCHFLLHGLNNYMTENAHGLNNQLDQLLVSFHESSTLHDQVVYFKMNEADEHLLSDMIQEYTMGEFLPKKEDYRGKVIWVYPLNNDEFLAVYTESGLFVMSFQKRLIEKVIDAKLDEFSLDKDQVFSRICNRKKSRNFFTAYTRTVSIPFLQIEEPCWTEYDFHMNSDVFYLTGETFVQDTSSYLTLIKDRIQKIPLVKEKSVFISSDNDSTKLYMDQLLEADEEHHTLFNESVVNLSHNALFTMVVDMQDIINDPIRYQEFFPSFLLQHLQFFQPFILSTQLIQNDNHLSHMWVFTYKN